MSNAGTWTLSWSCLAVLVTVGAAGCGPAAAPGQPVTLSGGGGKADSLGNREMTPSIEGDVAIARGLDHCDFAVDGFVLCPSPDSEPAQVTESDSQVDVTGSRVADYVRESRILFDVENDRSVDWTSGIRDTEWAQLIYVRPWTSSQWTLLKCDPNNPNAASYWANRVVIDLQARTITNDQSGAQKVSLDQCGAPKGDLEVATFPFPTNRWFGLAGDYEYIVSATPP